MGFVDLGEHGALHRVREEELDALLPDQRRPARTISLDLVVRLDQTRFLLLAFATTTAPLREELLFLFDAMVSTLHRASETPR